MKRFELLAPEKHDRKAFDCGIAALNLYLQQFANQDHKRGLSRIYVLAEDSRIIGYFSICAHAVSADALPERIQLGAYREVPYLLLGRLAVDLRYSGQGYGHALIFHAFKVTVETAEKIGVLGMIVDAKDENAISYYKKFGFQPLKATKYRLVLPYSVIKGLL